MTRTRSKVAAIAASAALVLTGCGSDFTGIYDIPLPGGADLGEHPYELKVHFRDVLDLVPQAGVKVNEVAIGRVGKIALAPDGWTAEVTLLVNSDINLPANALANLRQSSLLGEKYIELSPPADNQAAGAKLGQGAVIPIERTNRNVEVEEVLGALSMLLNGGGVEQLNTITKELNNATEGREADIRGLLENANTLVTNLDGQSANITRALDSLNRLSSTLMQQKDTLVTAVDNLGPGLQVLEQQRGQLVTMLQALRDLGGVATETINASQEDLVANLKALQPTLQKLGEAGADLPKALELLLTFPFADSATDAVQGDYFNLFLDVDLNLKEIVDNLGRARTNPLDGLPILGDVAQGRLPGADQGAPAPALPLPNIPGQPASTGQQAPTGGDQPARKNGAAGVFDVLSGGAG